MHQVRVRGHLRRNVQNARTGTRKKVRVRGHMMKVHAHHK